jgi:hypothetical protein
MRVGMGTLKEQALALRVGLLAGYVSVADVVAWADRLIVGDQAGAVPQALDLALLRPEGVADAITLLGQVPGDAAAPAIGRSAARVIYWRLASGGIDTERAARALYRLMREGFAPDPEFESMAYTFDDTVDLVKQGVYGTVDEVRVQMLAYLRRFATDEPAPGA